ncbi:MAG: NAD kinase [Ahrensia sp.]|nr:NAD kinase [Ahrensia sp.]
MSEPKIALLASASDDAQAALRALEALYTAVSPEDADIIVALGGDGFMLQTQLRFMNSGVPVYGMNQGTVGFLMNEFRAEDLPQRLARAKKATIHPLLMSATDAFGETHEEMAFNEVSLFRQSAQAARLKIDVDGSERLADLVCDGLMVATPQGSTAYNLSAHGPILPLKAPLLAMTPVSAFRPRNWRGALLPNSAKVRIAVLEHEKRPVNAVADNTEIKSAVEVHIREDRQSSGILLFDPEHGWEERILDEQFRY